MIGMELVTTNFPNTLFHGHLPHNCFVFLYFLLVFNFYCLDLFYCAAHFLCQLIILVLEEDILLQ